MGSLDKYRDKIGQNPDCCARILLQLLLGLSHLHSRNVVHRDIKPANVLVKAPFDIAIADLGLAQLSEDGRLERRCGTLPFIAPEVRKSSYDALADVWSAAVLMVQLRHGFPATNPRSSAWCDDLVKHLEGRARDPLDQILRRMLVVDPAIRPTSEQCIQLGCGNGLFTRLHDDRVVATRPVRLWNGTLIPGVDADVDDDEDGDAARVVASTPTPQWPGLPLPPLPPPPAQASEEMPRWMLSRGLVDVDQRRPAGQGGGQVAAPPATAAADNGDKAGVEGPLIRQKATRSRPAESRAARKRRKSQANPPPPPHPGMARVTRAMARKAKVTAAADRSPTKNAPGEIAPGED